MLFSGVTDEVLVIDIKKTIVVINKTFEKVKIWKKVNKYHSKYKYLMVKVYTKF